MHATTSFPEQSLFFTTGQRHGKGVETIDGLALRPALLARYRDLTRLRYDFPLVLVDSGAGAGELRSLSSLVDEVLCEASPRGLEGERLRKHVLRLEHEIRACVSQGVRGKLSELWSRAAEALAVPADESTEAILGHLAEKLQLDGDVIDCDNALPAQVITHLWQAEQDRKAKSFLGTVRRLRVQLADILRAAFIHSEAGQRPESLRAALGGAHRDAFDFAVMSKLVGRNAPADELPGARRRRIEWALEVLATQPFFSAPSHRPAEPRTGYGFRFDNCADAAQTFRTRLPKLAEVVKAIAIARLEADGRYVEALHDAFFDRLDANVLAADDIALFPDYLVCIPVGRNGAPENACLMDVLSAGMPVRVLVEASDVLEDSSPGAEHFAFGVRSARLANTATALGGVFVVQTTSSNLFALRERLAKAFRHRGAALVSVYAGDGAADDAVPPYLASAAAMESRAFPAFAYDPYAGDNQAARFSLDDNPQPEADWPIAPLEYADEHLQRVVEECPFTVADFLLCDRRHAAHFARIPREHWHPGMLPADEWLAQESTRSEDAVPYVLAVDADDVLQRVIVDASLMRTVARCRTFWHRLQEQGGIHNSHAAILLAREQAKWEQAKRQEIEALKAAAASSAAVVAMPANTAAAAAANGSGVAPGSPADEPAVPARDPDLAWIETARCPSCNECQLVNDRMFKYNENKQAYIADVAAGTYRQLVEAAEVCQVSIIHPGKPRDPDEPGLAELMQRAEPFR